MGSGCVGTGIESAMCIPGCSDGAVAGKVLYAVCGTCKNAPALAGKGLMNAGGPRMCAADISSQCSGVGGNSSGSPSGESGISRGGAGDTLLLLASP